jgi:hypothetical protein
LNQTELKVIELKKKLETIGFFTILLVVSSSITSVAAASDFVGVSDTMPGISYYYYTITYDDNGDKGKGSAWMSVRNITRESDKARLYILFETDYRTADPVILSEITIDYKIPDPIDPTNVFYVLGLIFITASILSFGQGWIINKATTPKTLNYTNGNNEIKIVYDNNGVLKSLYFNLTEGSNHYFYEIKRVIEPMYIYGGFGLVLIILVLLICCRPKKKTSSSKRR